MKITSRDVFQTCEIGNFGENHAPGRVATNWRTLAPLWPHGAHALEFSGRGPAQRRLMISYGCHQPAHSGAMVKTTSRIVFQAREIVDFGGNHGLDRVSDVRDREFR